jgi:hypothetical protein
MADDLEVKWREIERRSWDPNGKGTLVNIQPLLEAKKIKKFTEGFIAWNNEKKFLDTIDPSMDDLSEAMDTLKVFMQEFLRLLDNHDLKYLPDHFFNLSVVMTYAERVWRLMDILSKDTKSDGK